MAFYKWVKDTSRQFINGWTHDKQYMEARILEWAAFPFSRESSQPRDRTQVSCIAGEFYTNWATREAQEYWNGYLIPSPVGLPNPGIKPRSPALQVDSLPTELSGKPSQYMQRCSDLLLIRHIQIIIVVRAIYTPVYLSIYIHIHIPVCVCVHIYSFYIYVPRIGRLANWVTPIKDLGR